MGYAHSYKPSVLANEKRIVVAKAPFRFTPFLSDKKLIQRSIRANHEFSIHYSNIAVAEI